MYVLGPTGPADRPAPLPITGVILAGGRSKRMGEDKALIEVDGSPLVTRTAFALAETCEQVMVVGGAVEELADVELPEDTSVLSDAMPFQGPLGGLATALGASLTDWIFAVGVDMPFLNAQTARVLWDELEASGGPASGSVRVVMPVGEVGPEPLLALYHIDCLDVVDRVLVEGHRRVIDICPHAEVLEVPVEKLRSADPELLSLINVNTAEDLARACSLAESLSEHAPAEGAAQP